MTAIILGAGGQDGHYLSALLEAEGIEVVKVGRSENLRKIDLANFDEVAKLVKETKPDYIFHFAANSTTRHFAWKENHDAISTGSVHVLEAVHQFARGCKVFLSGSGLQFINEGKPIKETDPFNAGSIYSVGRIHTVYAARYYRTLGVQAYMGYFFHHDSPLRSDRHINKKIITTAKRIAEGSNEKLEIGDLSVKKEFGFAGDIVEGVWTLVRQDEVYEAVIGTGMAHAIEEWVEICFAMYGLDWQNHIVESDNFQPDFSILVSDPATINSLGWQHKTDIHALAKKMI